LATEKAEKKTEIQPRVTKGRILLADDSRDNQFLVQRMLKRMGLECDVVDNGLQAVDTVERDHYDLVLMDIMMPVLNGIEAIKRIRALPPPANSIPIVALSARAMPEDTISYLEAGAMGTLAKPVSMNDLDQVIGKYLKRDGQQPSLHV
jgi:CheY-like chemotaxis protein